MEKNKLDGSTNRRKFLGTLTAGAAAMGMAGLAPFQNASANPGLSLDESTEDEWFKQIKGKHRVVFDVTQPHEVYPFAWPRVFLITNEKTGTMPKDCSVVVVLRHTAIGYAMKHEMWPKYNLGELFKADDPATKKPSKRNPFWQPEKGAFKIPGVGEVAIGINQLQESGVMFCVCDMALTVYSAAIADGMKMSAADIKKDWTDNLLPNIQVVPSGVWAVGRAQERGCGYIFAS